MTCIVGIVDKSNDNVIIGGDSAGCSLNNIFIRKDSKVFKNGDFVFGCSSSFRMIQLLKFSFKPPKIKNKDIYEYMCTDFINTIRKCFENGGYLHKSNEVEQGGIFLVAYKNRLFKVDCDFQVAENLEGIDACGSGMDFALGALYALKNNPMQNYDKIYNALKTAELLSNSVRSPFVIINTEDTIFSNLIKWRK